MNTSAQATVEFSRITNHLPWCPGNMICTKCGRRGCNGCIYTEETERNGECNSNEVGLCIICKGSWKEKDINLYQPNSSEWDTRENWSR